MDSLVSDNHNWVEALDNQYVRCTKCNYKQLKNTLPLYRVVDRDQVVCNVHLERSGFTDLKPRYWWVNIGYGYVQPCSIILPFIEQTDIWQLYRSAFNNDPQNKQYRS